MGIASSRATIKKVKRKSIIDMLRKEKKWNDLKCSIKIIKGRKSVEDQNRKKRTITTNRKQGY